MNNDIKFKSLTDLYVRILPALRSRTKELHRKGFLYVHEEDIWNFLKEFRWGNSSNLDLGSMVNDIFNINESEIDAYVKEELRKSHRPINDTYDN
jgi:hypothetical protein